jgi:hypothetical protein
MHKQLLTNGEKKRKRLTQLSLSEMMTIIILFHQSCYRTFKAFYLERVLKYLQKEFPQLVSYPRFIAPMPSVLGPLCAYAIFNKGKATGISFIDSTPIKVCHNIRIDRNKVFAGLAARGKHSMGWFYGFKLHLVANDLGEILELRLFTEKASFNVCFCPGSPFAKKKIFGLTKTPP